MDDSPLPRGSVAAEAHAGAEVLRIPAERLSWVGEARHVVAHYGLGDEYLDALLRTLARHPEAVFPADVPVIAEAFTDEGIACGQDPCRCEEIARRVYGIIFAATATP